MSIGDLNGLAGRIHRYTMGLSDAVNVVWMWKHTRRDFMSIWIRFSHLFQKVDGVFHEKPILETVKLKIIISLFETVRLSVLI